jgi:hypothetical protein
LRGPGWLVGFRPIALRLTELGAEGADLLFNPGDVLVGSFAWVGS